MNPNQPAAIGGLSPDAFSSLFQSINGLRNRRALVALLGCMVVGILVAGLFSLMATRLGFFVAFLGGLFLFVAAATGIHAAGVLLMDQARGAPLRSLPDAVVYGLLCIPKFIVLVLALALVAIAVFIVLAIVYFICKIPVLGPILFVIVFPLSVVVSGLTLCGLFLCMFLALPAIWEQPEKFQKAQAAFDTAAADLAKAADSPPRELAAPLSALVKACKGCHDDFRKKD